MNKISETNFDKYEVVKRIERMIAQELVVCYTDAILGSALDIPTKTVEEIVQIKFSDWKLSGMFDSVSDMRNHYGILPNEMVEDKPSDTAILYYLQYAANCVQRVNDVCAESLGLLGYKIKFHDKSYPSGVFIKVDSLLEHLGAKRIFDENTREIAVVPKDELVEAIAHENPDLMSLLNQYRALNTKGDLAKKRQIFSTLYRDWYEFDIEILGKSPVYISSFLGDLGFLIGDIVRHNENKIRNKHAAKMLAELSDDEKEIYYDLTFDYFLAFRAMLPCVRGKEIVDKLKKEKEEFKCPHHKSSANVNP